MSQSAPPVLEYTKPTRPTMLAWQSIVAAFGGLLFIPTFMCTCGHLGIHALLATVPTVLLAWWGFARRLSTVGRIIAGVTAALITFALSKNVLDIGWFGHDPLFR